MPSLVVHVTESAARRSLTETTTGTAASWSPNERGNDDPASTTTANRERIIIVADSVLPESEPIRDQHSERVVRWYNNGYYGMVCRWMLQTDRERSWEQNKTKRMSRDEKGKKGQLRVFVCL